MTTDASRNGSSENSSEEEKVRVQKVRLKTGLNIWTGRVQEEYLTQLKPWSRAAKIFREMRDEATIGSLLESIKTPLISSPFEVHPADDTAEAKKAAEMVEKALFHMPGMEWREHVEEMLDFVDFGFSISEKVFYKDKEGHLLPHTLLPAGQETLERWGDPDQLGQVTSFIQRDPVTGQLKEAPMDKLLHFTWRSRKRDPMGYSILRSLYRPWFFMRNLEVLEAIGVERDVGNTPVAQLGETYLTDEQYEDLEKGLGGLRVDETAYLIVPGDIKVEPLGSGTKVYDVRGIIRDYQHKIRQRFFADFLSMGSERQGTQALAREMTTFFNLALRAVQERMLEVWQRQLIKPLLLLNGMDSDNPPTLSWSKPGSRNVQALAQSLQTLAQSGALTPDDSLEKHLREELGLPPTIINPRRQEQPGENGNNNNPNGPTPGKNGVPAKKPAGEPGRVTPEKKMEHSEFEDDLPLLLEFWNNHEEPRQNPLGYEGHHYDQVELEPTMTAPQSGTVMYRFDIRSLSSGRLAGELQVTVPDRGNGNTAYIHFVEIYDHAKGRETVQSIRQQFRRLFPHITSVEGFRVTGMRQQVPEDARAFLEA